MEKERLVSIVEAVQRGEKGASTELYDIFYDDIYNHIVKTVKDSELADDLSQDTFMEILEKIDSLREPIAFESWSKQIAYHKCTAYFRKRRDLLVDEDEEGNSVIDSISEDREEFIPDEALDKNELKKTIHKMINSLPEEQRSALLLRYFNEISVKEIAEIQGVSEGTVKSRLNYARKAIKQAVNEYEKKHSVKLHSAGVLPLLLWLFREYRITNNLSLTNTATDVFIISEEAVTTAAATGATIIGSIFVPKVVASIALATVTIGGAAALFHTNFQLDRFDHAKKQESSIISEITSEDENHISTESSYYVSEGFQFVTEEDSSNALGNTKEESSLRNDSAICKHLWTQGPQVIQYGKVIYDSQYCIRCETEKMVYDRDAEAGPCLNGGVHSWEVEEKFEYGEIVYASRHCGICGFSEVLYESETKVVPCSNGGAHTWIAGETKYQNGVMVYDCMYCKVCGATKVNYDTGADTVTCSSGGEHKWIKVGQLQQDGAVYDRLQCAECGTEEQRINLEIEVVDCLHGGPHEWDPFTEEYQDGVLVYQSVKCRTCNTIEAVFDDRIFDETDQNGEPICRHDWNYFTTVQSDYIYERRSCNICGVCEDIEVNENPCEHDWYYMNGIYLDYIEESRTCNICAIYESIKVYENTCEHVWEKHYIYEGDVAIHTSTVCTVCSCVLE